jgi:hypothetical protein
MEDFSFVKRAKKGCQNTKKVQKNHNEAKKMRVIAENKRAKKEVRKRVSSNYKYVREDKHAHANQIIGKNNIDYDDNPDEYSEESPFEFWSPLYETY